MMNDKLADIEDPIGDLDTSVRALHRLADGMSDGDDAGCVVRMMAYHFEEIHRRLRKRFNAAWEAEKGEHPAPKAVS